MNQLYTILGIDLGACMSGSSAYIMAKVDPDKRDFEIIEQFREPPHKSVEACRDYLYERIKMHPVDAIAVDAPLSIPRPLIDPGFIQPPREGSGEILNPYLFRHTDYHIWKTYGLKPMPPAGDRIGRLTARMIELLQRLDYRFPSIRLQEQSIPLYEVYPRQIAHTLGHPDYKKHPHTLISRLTTSCPIEDEHLLDALLCCYGGAKILRGDTAWPVDQIGLEGWCFPVI